MDDQSVPARGGGCACGGTRGQRNDRSRPRPARVRDAGGGEGVPRGRAAGPRPVPARRHGRRGGDDQGRDRRREADLRPRRLRRRRHLCDGARRPHPARARSRRRLASAEPLRGRLRPAARDARAPRRRGLRADPDRGLRRDRRRGGRRGAAARPRRRRHRPPPARRDASGLPRRRHSPFRLSVPRAVRHRRRLQAGRGAARPG